MRRLSMLVAVVGAVAMIPAGAVAGNGCGTVSGAGPIYVDDRGDEGGLWIYAENTGDSALQAGGSHPVLNYSDDCVNGDGPYDAMIY